MTTKAKDDDRTELHQYAVYELNGITYLPHYRDVKRYVGPGYPRHNKNVYTVAELFSAGATPSTAFLWKRSEYGIMKVGGV